MNEQLKQRQMNYFQEESKANKIKEILAANPELCAADFMVYGLNNMELAVPQWYDKSHVEFYGFEDMQQMQSVIDQSEMCTEVDQLLHNAMCEFDI